MYNALEVNDAIRRLCKEKKIRVNDLLFQSELGVNALRQMVAKNDISVFRLAKIADTLNCSLDYLLKRTYEPSINMLKIDRDLTVQDAYDIASDSVKDAVRALLNL